MLNEESVRVYEEKKTYQNRKNVLMIHSLFRVFDIDGVFTEQSDL